MNICFVELEQVEQRFFREQLAEHDMLFVSTLDEVPPEVEVLSVFIYQEITADFLAKCPGLKLIATRSGSVDHIDMEACRSCGVTVSTVPHYGDTTVAEHTFALILALARRLREVMSLPKQGGFSYAGSRGMELQGKTLGIIGMGRIAQRVTHLAHAFQMKVIAYDVEASPELAQSLGFTYVTLAELLRESHVVSLHASLRPETYHILNRETLAQCRPGVLVINTARGALIDTQALREALDSGHVGGAGLDVLQDERILRQSAQKIIAAEIIRHLRSDARAQDARDADRLLELQELMLGDAVLAKCNVVFTPHVAFNSDEAIQRLHVGTVENIRAFVDGHPVNTA
jgi:D-lactate dehydrogenase